MPVAHDGKMYYLHNGKMKSVFQNIIIIIIRDRAFQSGRSQVTCSMGWSAIPNNHSMLKMHGILKVIYHPILWAGSTASSSVLVAETFYGIANSVLVEQQSHTWQWPREASLISLHWQGWVGIPGQGGAFLGGPGEACWEVGWVILAWPMSARILSPPEPPDMSLSLFKLVPATVYSWWFYS